MIGDFLTDSIKGIILAAVQMGHAAACAGLTEEQALVEARKTLNQELYNNCLAEAMKGRIQ